MGSMVSKLKTAATHFADPVLLIMALAAGVRSGYGLTFTYNIVAFFEQYQPGVNVCNYYFMLL